MKVIVCSGDSHACGQGGRQVAPDPAGFRSPETAGGDLRFWPFCVKGYVTLLRERVNAHTGSFARELSSEEIARETGIALHDFARVEREIHLTLEGELMRFQFREQPDASRVTISVDGEAKAEADLTSDAPPVGGFRGYQTLAVSCAPGRHEVTLRGNALLYRIECYGGNFAVVNAGVGSCPARRFLDEYWQTHVAPYRPDILLAEAHSINDWLTRQPPEDSRGDLRAYLRRAKREGATPVLMTVSPILGEQAEPFSPHPYAEYVEASRQAARDEGSLLIDANALIPAKPALFADNWHPNAVGHEIYASAAFEALNPLLGEGKGTQNA